MRPLLATDLELLRALKENEGQGDLRGLWDKVLQIRRMNSRSLLFGYRAARRLCQAGLIEQERDYLRLRRDR